MSYLIQNGFIDRDPKGGLTITAKAVSLCLKPFDEENQSDFLTTASRIEAVMASAKAARQSA